MGAKRRTQAGDRGARASAKVLKSALALFSRQGYRATSMRQIAARSGLSLGNLYHHFGNKEAIFRTLLDTYWERLRDPDLPLNRIFAAARFPDDLEDMAGAVDAVVSDNAPYILLIYIDVIEFRGRHLRDFYSTMADRFRRVYGARFERMKREGRFGEVDPMVGVMVATRWLFYFFTIERCFGVPMHFGMSPDQAVREFFRILRLGLDPRPAESPSPGSERSVPQAGSDRPGR